MSAACAMCGRTEDQHNRHVRFTLPDPVLHTRDREAAQGTWLSHADARSSVMMQVPDVGPFIRALLPVGLEGGTSITFGVWLGVRPDDLQRAFKLWWEPEYAGLALDGRLANPIQPWGLLATPVRAVVRHPDETPYCESSPDPMLAEVLVKQWPHDLVLGPLDV